MFTAQIVCCVQAVLLLGGGSALVPFSLHAKICFPAQYLCGAETHPSTDLPAALVQATVEAGYLIAQAVLYVCVLYFMAGFDRTAGESVKPALYCVCLTCLSFAPMCPSWRMHDWCASHILPTAQP